MFKNKQIKIGDGALFTRANSQYWQCRMTLDSGKIVRKTTGIRYTDDPDGKDAKLFAHRIWGLKIGMTGRNREQAYKNFCKEICEDCGYTPTQLSLKEGIAKYFESFETKNTAKNTLRLYKDALKKFEKHIGGITLIDEISTNQIRNFKAYLIKNFSKETARGTFNDIKIFFRFLLNNNYIEKNQIEKVEGIERDTQEKDITTYKKHEVELLLKETKGTFWETMIMIGRYTGQRLMDCFNLTWKQIDLSGDGKIEFHIEKTKNRGRYIHTQPFIFKPLKDYLQTLPNKHGRLFTFTKLQANLSREFHEILLRLAIIKEQPKPEGKRRNRAKLTFHSFRKTLNKEMRDMKFDTPFRAQFIGHTEEINESNYTPKFDDTTVQAQLKQMESELYM